MREIGFRCPPPLLSPPPHTQPFPTHSHTFLSPLVFLPQNLPPFLVPHTHYTYLLLRPDHFTLPPPGVLCLEELEHAKARGAHIYAEYVGGAFTCDAHHMTEPHPDGKGGSRV